MLDSINIREILLDKGMFQAIDGSYVSEKMIGRIIPDREKGTAICKDFHGNRIAIIHWPISKNEQ